jgi:adenylate kinase
MSANKRGPRFIISGAPASGKGTQCEFIKKEFRVIHLSTGDMLRAAVEAQTALGLEAKGYMDSGALVPDETIIGVVIARLREPDCVESGWLLDGFPRTRAQADALEKAGIECDVFIQIDVDDGLLVERVVGRRLDPETGTIYHLKFSPPPFDNPALLKRLVHRSDDTEEKAVSRIQTYKKNLDSIIEKYSSKMIRIDGNKVPKEVWLTMFDMIVKKMSADAKFKSRGPSEFTCCLTYFPIFGYEAKS